MLPKVLVTTTLTAATALGVEDTSIADTDS